MVEPIERIDRYQQVEERTVVDQAHQIGEDNPKLSNIFVQNCYNPYEVQPSMMNSLATMNQNAPYPLVPPCISININRYNEISLNIFNNNLVEKPQ